MMDEVDAGRGELKFTHVNSLKFIALLLFQIEDSLS